jgi:hypothetical protein
MGGFPDFGPKLGQAVGDEKQNQGFGGEAIADADKDHVIGELATDERR